MDRQSTPDRCALLFVWILIGEDCLYQLPEPLLCRHRGGDEGDLYLQPYVEAV